MKRFVAPAAFALMAATGVVAPASEASAHGGPADDETSSNYRTRVRAIEPAISGVAVRVIDAGTRLELINRGDVPVVVLGYDGEPYLRVGADGVFENRRSAATYLNTSRDAGVVLPDLVDPDAVPEWRHVSAGSTARWHDHRAHWMSRVAPPRVQADSTVEQVIFDPWVTVGVVASSVESTFHRSSQFLYAALMAAAATQVASRAGRHRPGPHLAAGLAALLALGMAGASRLDGLSNSQVATSLSGTLDRSLTVSVLAIGAVLLVDFVLGLLCTSRTPELGG